MINTRVPAGNASSRAQGEQEAVFPSLDFLGLVIEAPVMAGLTGSSAAGCRYFLLYQEFV